jgi:hypothetical protein
MRCLLEESKQKLSCAFGVRVSYLFRGQETSNHCAAGAARTTKPARRAKGRACPGLDPGMPGVTEKVIPRGACRPSGNRSCVASNTASLPSRCRLPLRGLWAPTHHRTEARLEQRAIGQPLLRCLNSGIGQPLLRCLNSGIHALAMPSLWPAFGTRLRGRCGLVRRNVPARAALERVFFTCHIHV